LDVNYKIFLLIEGNSGTTTTSTITSYMYLVITTAIWMNKTSNKPRMKTTDGTGAQNVPFGVFGIMLPYKTVRSTHFSNLCVRI
jgi:hypothetical protein